MKLRSFLISICAGAIPSLLLAANDPIQITESVLVEKVYTDATLLSQLQSNKYEKDSELLEQRSKYQPVWKSEVYFQDSNERPLASFIPTFGPTYGFSTGIAQTFSRGIEIQAKLFGDLTTTADNFIDKATRTGLNLQGRIDLLKNFMGRLDQAELSSNQLQYEKTQIQNHIDLRAFELEMRKLFWSLVSIEEKKIIANNLLETANVQYKDSLSRKRNFIADASDTERYKAQVANRQSTLYTLNYQKDITLQQIKSLLPSLASKSIQVGRYDRKKMTDDVLMCVSKIKIQNKTPWENTQLDELLDLIRKDYEQKKIVDDQTSGADLAIQTELQVSGVDRGFEDSFSDFTGNGKFGYQVGLMLDVPLGSATKKTEAAKLRSSHERFLVNEKETRASVEAQQTQLISLIDTLFASMRNYKENNKTLRNNIKRMEQKYKQARIDVRDLVLEQDALSQNALSEVDAHLAIMHVLLDYFKIFTEDPCPINQLHTQLKDKKEA